MRNIIVLLFVSTLLSGLAFAQDATLSDEASRQWRVKVDTETGFILPDTSRNYGSHLWQETGARASFDLSEEYSLSVAPRFSNSILDSGVAESGALALDDTRLSFEAKNLGAIEPSNIKLTGALSLAVPTSRLTLSPAEDRGFLTYVEPSVALTKDWERWSWRNELGGRLYVNESKFYNEYRYRDQNATVKTLATANKPNSLLRQSFSSTISYSVLPKLSISLNAYADVDWKHNPETLKQQTAAKPTAPSGGAVSTAAVSGAASAAAPAATTTRRAASVVAVPRASLTPEVSYEVIDNLTVAAGYSLGRRPGGSVSPLGEYWLGNFAIDKETSTYLNLSYNF